MFEIKKNDFLYFRMLPDTLKASKDSIYDFTFEDRFIIYHYRDHVKNHYIALDKTTGYGSYVLASRDTLDDKSYPMMIPAILYSIKYTGDRRMNMEAQVDNDDWVSMIFRCLLPQIGFSIREEQVEMANKMYAGLTGKKITLCEAGVGTGKTMSYLAAGFAAARVKKDYQYASNPITISTSSIDLQREIIEKEIPRLSQVLMDAGIIKKPLRSVLRKGKEHYFCLRRYADYVQAIESMGEKYSRTLELLDMLDIPSNGFDLDQVQIPSHIKAKICVSGSCHKCPYRNGCQYAQFVKRASEKGVYDIQVTNHNLLLTSQKMKATAGTGVLLDSNYYIIDEAHKLVEAANSVYGAQITPSTIPELLNSVKYACKKEGVKEAYRDLLKVTKDMNANLFLKVGMTLDESEDVLITQAGIMIGGICKRNPIVFVKEYLQTILFAVATCSSVATIPLNLKTAKRLGAAEDVADFVIPFGAVINMDGTAIYEAVAAIFAAQVFGIELTFAQQLMIMLSAVLASIGTAGVPGSGLIMLTVVLNAAGLPLEAVGLLAGVDRFLNMGRMIPNIFGDGATSMVVSKMEGKLGEMMTEAEYEKQISSV